jgi:hypothetical protein
MRSHVWAIVLAPALASCVHRVAPPVDRWYGDLHALAQEAAKVRGLTLTQRFEVIELDDAAYTAEVRRRARPALERQFRALDATLHPGRAPKPSASGGSGGEDALFAAYFPEQSQLLIRRDLPKLLAEQGDESILRVVAHEVGHVLQHQRGLPMRMLPDDAIDQAFVRMALLEGDAHLTATLLIAARQHEAPARAVAQYRYAMRGEDPTRDALDQQHLSPAVRDILLFKYVTAGQFIGDLYLAGGLQLVDQVMAHPPARSDAVADGNRWLHGSAGRLARSGEPSLHVGPVIIRAHVDEWTAPLFASGAMSKDPAGIGDELLHTCEDDELSVQDGIVVWKMLWTSKATPSAEAMRGIGASFDLDPKEIAVAGSGPVLALAAGGDPARRQQLADAAARTTREDAELPPFGMHDVPNLARARAYHEPGPATVTNGLWTHADLGLSLPLEAGVLTSDGPSWLSLFTPDTFLFMLFIDAPLAPADTKLNLYGKSLAENFLHGRSPFEAEGKKRQWQPRDLGWTKALEVREVHDHIVTHARNVSLCHGHASLLLLGFGDGEASAARLEGWFDHLKGSAEQPLCSQP